MCQIKAKQVEGAIDNESKQAVSGEKTFKDKAVFEDKTGRYHVSIHDGFIYWTKDSEKLNDTGNIRQGVLDGTLVTQTFSNGVWTDKKKK